MRLCRERRWWGAPGRSRLAAATQSDHRKLFINQLGRQFSPGATVENARHCSGGRSSPMTNSRLGQCFGIAGLKLERTAQRAVETYAFGFFPGNVGEV